VHGEYTRAHEIHTCNVVPCTVNVGPESVGGYRGWVYKSTVVHHAGACETSLGKPCEGFDGSDAAPRPTFAPMSSHACYFTRSWRPRGGWTLCSVDVTIILYITPPRHVPKIFFIGRTRPTVVVLRFPSYRWSADERPEQTVFVTNYIVIVQQSWWRCSRWYPTIILCLIVLVSRTSIMTNVQNRPVC
jgi:hypothetical protein